jgi:hypothetical protein
VETVIASYSYRSKLLRNVIAIYCFGSDNMIEAIMCNAATFWSNVADLCVHKYLEIQFLSESFASPCYSLKIVSMVRVEYLAVVPERCESQVANYNFLNNIWQYHSDVSDLAEADTSQVIMFLFTDRT